MPTFPLAQLTTSNTLDVWRIRLNDLLSTLGIDSNGAFTGITVVASLTNTGVIKLASNAEALTGTDSAKAIVPSSLKYVLDNRNSSTSGTGLIEIATNTEANTGTDNVRAIVPSSLKNVLDTRTATTSVTGLIQLATNTDANTGTDSAKAIVSSSLKNVLDTRMATNTEANTGTDTSKFISPSSLKNVLDTRTTTTSVTGLVQLATNVETQTGTNTTKAVTPAGVAAAFKSAQALESFVMAVTAETANLVSGTGKLKFRCPYAFTVTDVRASLNTAQSTGSVITVDINKNGTSILSTRLTFDNTESTTKTATIPPVISTTSIADDDELSIDIDQIGDGTAKGLKVAIIGYRS